MRDHLGDLTRREAGGRAETGGALAGHTIGPAPGPLVVVMTLNRQPAGPEGDVANSCGDCWRRFPLQVPNAPFHEEFAGPPGLTVRVPGRRIGVAAVG